VGYIPIRARVRQGKSHIRPIRDGVRFLLIIFRVGTLYSPLKIFLPVSFTFFATGLVYYLYTYLSSGRFTNMSALLFTTSVVIFLMGLVSEQITSLLYSKLK
jgi:predicted PurR-regulated permease PerM